jgi:hypothetical protein
MSGSAQARSATRVVARRDDEILRAVTQVLQAYEPPRMRCWPCFGRRRAWNVSHAAEWTQAQTEARDAVGLPEGQPVPFDVAVAHLAEPLRPDPANPTGAGTDRMPAAFAATMTIGGTGYCDTDAELIAAATAGVVARNSVPAGGDASVAAGASTSSVPAATP